MMLQHHWTDLFKACILFTTYSYEAPLQLQAIFVSTRGNALTMKVYLSNSPTYIPTDRIPASNRF